MKLLPIVEVWWRDSEVEEGGWSDLSEALGRKCPIIRTVGMLLEKTEDTVLIASCMSEEDTNGRFRIPTSCVEHFYIIKPQSDEEVDVYD